MVAVHGQHQDLRARLAPQDLASREDAVSVGERDVHGDDVWLEVVHHLKGLAARRRFTDDGDVLGRGEDGTQSFSKQMMVVHQEDFDRRNGAHGNL